MSADELLRGVCPVLEVPFHSDETVDSAGFAAVLEHTMQAGVSAVMFPGFASEYHKLSDEESDRLTGTLLDETRLRPDIAAIVSVPRHATRLAVDAARRAIDRGADALNILPPHFLRPPKAEIAAHLVALLEAAGDVPVIVQYAPDQTGSPLDSDLLTSLAASFPNLARVKVEASPPGPMVSDLLSRSPSLRSLIGYAGLFLPDAARRGAVGVQPGCSFVELYVRIWRYYEDGLWREGDDLHRRLLPYLTYWMQDVELIISVEKLITARRGIITSARCRSPRRDLDPYEAGMVDQFMTEFGDMLGVAG